MLSEWFSDTASGFDDTFVQPRDGIERGEDRALLPHRNVGSMFASEHDPPVDLAQVVVMLGALLLGPVAGASEGERHAMPCHRDAVFELGRILRMNAGTQSDSARDPFGRRHRGEFVRV